MEDIIIKNLLKIFVILSIPFMFGNCLREDQLRLPFQTCTPKEIGDGWEIATPAS